MIQQYDCITHMQQAMNNNNPIHRVQIFINQHKSGGSSSKWQQSSVYLAIITRILDSTLCSVPNSLSSSKHIIVTITVCFQNAKTDIFQVSRIVHESHALEARLTLSHIKVPKSCIKAGNLWEKFFFLFIWFYCPVFHDNLIVVWVEHGWG